MNTELNDFYPTIDHWRVMEQLEKSALILKRYSDADLESSQAWKIVKEIDLFDAFVEEAHKIVYAGIEHWSARTIIYYLRHNTAVTDGDTKFKINDHHSPSFARMSMAIFPMLNGLFELRSSAGGADKSVEVSNAV